MIEQVHKLQLQGIVAGIMVGKGSLSDVPEHMRVAEKLLLSGRYSFVYTSPEAVLTISKWRNVLTSSVSEKIVAIAVDEAHCASQWYVVHVLHVYEPWSWDLNQL